MSDLYFLVARVDDGTYLQKDTSWGKISTAKRLDHREAYRVRADRESGLGVPCAVISVNEWATLKLKEDGHWE